MTISIDAEALARARAVPIADEIHRRGIKLRRQGRELVGPCPVCGDGGKGARSDRFAAHIGKNTWLCRRCERGGDVVELVRHLDGVGFQNAVATLSGWKFSSPAPQLAPMARPAVDCAAEEERKR